MDYIYKEKEPQPVIEAPKQENIELDYGDFIEKNNGVSTADFAVNESAANETNGKKKSFFKKFFSRFFYNGED